jgi:class 3 adenylate cyclase
MAPADTSGAIPPVRYARSGDVHIAYQVLGEGPLDLVYFPGWVSHLEHAWEEPGVARFYRRLASFSRLILFDKRGTGLSDRVSDAALPNLEQRMDDLRAVMDAAGSERAALFGISEGGPLSVLFAATYPGRTTALVLYGTYARFLQAADYPWRPSTAAFEAFVQAIEERWGQPLSVRLFAPSAGDDPHFRAWWASAMRLGASPGAALALLRMNTEIDVRDILPAVRVPTLVLHRAGDRLVDPGASRDLAARIPGARYVELAGADHLPFVGDSDAIVAEVQEFLTGVRTSVEPERVLATVLFVDIVDSTAQAAALGDRRWGELLDAHLRLLRREITRFRGCEIKALGDGILATFDGPTRAIRCACVIRDIVRPLGVEVRAGLHTGEIERRGDDVGGIAVHIGARIAAGAAPGEVLVSSTVKDLAAGSGLRFADRGTHALRGVPGEWRLFAVEG